MVEKEILPPQAIDALAWLDPSLARKNIRGVSRPRDAEAPPPSESEEAAGSESESAESNTASWPPGGNGRRRPGRGAAITQALLLVAFGAAVLVALFFDSRFYYGIDVDGRPIHKEKQRASDQGFEVGPVSTGSAIGSHDLGELPSFNDAPFLNDPLLDLSRSSDRDRQEAIGASG